MLWIHKNRFSFEFMQCNVFNFLIQKYLNFLACTLVVPCLYQYHLTFHHNLNVYSSCYQVIESVGQFGSSLAQLHHFDGSSKFIQVFLCIFCYTTTFQKLYQAFYLAIDFKVQVFSVIVLLKMFVDCNCEQNKLFNRELQGFE